MAGDEGKAWEMHFRVFNSRLDKFDALFAKLFDTSNKTQVLLERNTVITEQIKEKTADFETMQKETNDRMERAEQQLITLKDAVSHVNTDLAPVQDHVKLVGGWVESVSRIPSLLKFLTIVFGFVIAGYGVFSIVKDSIGLMHK